MNRFTSEASQVVTTYVIGTTRNILLGIDLCYAIEKEKYYHIPAILVFPSIYTGYQVYKNKKTIVDWLHDSF